MDNRILRVISNYVANGTIRSEEEVRSKLIVPLIEALGYPSYLRAESFPVYSHHGSKKLSTTEADFVLFDDCGFNNHSNDNEEDVEWVQNHSLLVVEAKRPDEMPDVQGQARFYAMWLRAIAYIVTDGKCIKGWLLNSLCADKLIIDAKINSNTVFDALLQFDYSSLSRNKEEKVSENDYSIITDAKDLNFPDESFEYMRRALGRNAEGLDDLQLVSKYLASCDFILQNDIRYGIPQCALGLLRAVYEATVFADNIQPCDEGTLYLSYWEDVDSYQYDSEVLHFKVGFLKGNPVYFESSYDLSGDCVSERILKTKKIIELNKAKRWTLYYVDEKEKQLVIDFMLMKGFSAHQKEERVKYELLLCGFNQLLDIEKHYDVKFTIGEIDDYNELLHKIEMVYNGFHMIENCTLTIPCERIEDLIIDAPMVIHEGSIPNMTDLSIFGIVFHPTRTMLLPKNYELKKNSIELSICCEYGLV